MPISPSYRTVSIKPVTGPLDMRSQPDVLRLGSYRRRINWEITNSGKPGRTRGFQKVLSQTPYNNQDLHDQLLSLQTFYDDLAIPDSRSRAVISYPPSSRTCGTTLRIRDTGRQPITMLAELISAEGRRKMMAGTQNRLYVLEEPIGNWKIIADAYGGVPEGGLPERRWKAPAQVGNISILTNNFDPVMWYQFDGITSGCSMQAVHPVDDLALIGLTRAGVAFSWRGIVFLGDVTMDGVRYPHRLVWGDKDAPLSFDFAAEGTVADLQDLDYGETIKGGIALNNYLLVVTTRGIWQLTVSTDTSTPNAPVFNFTQLYSEPKTGQACIVYPNTLCSDGESIYYLGNDDFYRFNLYLPVPEATPWIHAATSLVFDGIQGLVNPIDDNICESHIAWYDPRSQSIGLSWVEQGVPLIPEEEECCKAYREFSPSGAGFPSRTLTFQLPNQFASELDFGVTAACNFTPSPGVTFANWLRNVLCACSEAEIFDFLDQPVKTGGSVPVTPPLIACYRITESGETRITMNGEIRLLEGCEEAAPPEPEPQPTPVPMPVPPPSSTALSVDVVMDDMTLDSLIELESEPDVTGQVTVDPAEPANFFASTLGRLWDATVGYEYFTSWETDGIGFITSAHKLYAIKFRAAPIGGDPYTGPFTWSISAGALPPGLVLETTTSDICQLQGTPTTAGLAYTFTVRATSSEGNIGEFVATMNVFTPLSLTNIDDLIAWLKVAFAAQSTATSDGIMLAHGNATGDNRFFWAFGPQSGVTTARFAGVIVDMFGNAREFPQMIIYPDGSFWVTTARAAYGACLWLKPGIVPPELLANYPGNYPFDGSTGSGPPVGEPDPITFVEI